MVGLSLLRYKLAQITSTVGSAPMSAITHYAPIRSIEPWENSGKMVINFAEPARELGPLKLTKNGRLKHLQGLRYTNFERLKKVTSLDEAF